MQWVVPFYSAWLAYKRHDYTEADVRTVLDVIAVASGPSAKAMQAAGMLTGSGRRVDYAKTGKKVSGYTDTGVTLITDKPMSGVDSKDTKFGLENCWGK